MKPWKSSNETLVPRTFCKLLAFLSLMCSAASHGYVLQHFCEPASRFGGMLDDILLDARNRYRKKEGTFFVPNFRRQRNVTQCLGRVFDPKMRVTAFVDTRPHRQRNGEYWRRHLPAARTRSVCVLLFAMCHIAKCHIAPY